MNSFRTLYKYAISHDLEGHKHLSMADDQELPHDQLPEDHPPIWIEPPKHATEVQMLERVETRAGQYQDVMVLYRGGERDERAAAWCEERGWRYQQSDFFYGCEAQCVVLIHCIMRAEWITRARNMLIIINER